MTLLMVPGSVLLASAIVTYITLYWVLMTNVIAGDNMNVAFRSIRSLGKQIAEDSTSLVSIAWPITLSLIAAVFFVGKDSAPGRHTPARRTIALLSIGISGVVFSALTLAAIASIGDQATANRLWLMIIAAVFMIILTFWVGNDALATRRRLRAEAKSEFRAAEKMTSRYRHRYGRMIRHPWRRASLILATLLLLSTVVTNLLLMLPTGATVTDALGAWETELAYARFTLNSLITVVIIAASQAGRRVIERRSFRVLARSAEIAILTINVLVTSVVTISQPSTEATGATQTAIVMATAIPLFILFAPPSWRLSLVRCAADIQMYACGRYAQEARRDWSALRRRRRNGQGPKFARPLRTPAEADWANRRRRSAPQSPPLSASRWL